MSIRIITDSTTDINREQAQQLDITVVPLKVIFNDREYKEGIDITIEGFYEELVKAEKLPTTSQPSPDDFLGYFNDAKEAGDSVIVILISGKLSGTVQSALIAREMADYQDIHIIDSNNAVIGLRTLVEHAVKLRKEGRTVDEIVNAISTLKDKVVLLAMVDTLEYLHKGGRLSKSSAILGSLLRFKPILTLKDGVITVVGKERGVNKGIARILETMEEYGEVDRDYPVNLGFTAEGSKCVMLKDSLVKKYGLEGMRMFPVGCVVGAHVGPGACVITYIKK